MTKTKREITRPLPKHKELDSQEFWAGTKEKEFRYQQCDNCETVIFYSRRHCTGCTSGNLVWKKAAGTGTVYTFSIVRQSYHPFFRNMAPYTVAFIDMDEGPRILSNVVGIDADEVKIGQRVQLEWEEHEALNIPLFKPV
ncbi:MAG: Zn-ribbon domain-containing OB-fold protein [Pseudomonadales bacterium]|nr:Zn-ribbon domain-containing OB-fold protein [Pseudomonadales bacterium]